MCVFCCYLRNIEIMTKVWGLEELLLISVSAVLRTDSGCSSQLSDTVGNAAHLPCRQNGIRARSGNRCCRACCQTISHLMLIRSTGVALAVFELPCNCKSWLWKMLFFTISSVALEIQREPRRSKKLSTVLVLLALGGWPGLCFPAAFSPQQPRLQLFSGCPS